MSTVGPDDDSPPPRRSVGTAAGRGALLLFIAVLLGVVLLNTVDDEETAVKSSGAKKAATTTTTVKAAKATTTTLREPEAVTVFVANGADVNGAAGNVKTQLDAQNYNTLSPGNTETTFDTTSVYFAVGYQGEAQAIAQLIGAPAAGVKAVPADLDLPESRDANVIVIVGKDIAKPGPTTTAARSSSAATTTRRTTTTASDEAID